MILDLMSQMRFKGDGANNNGDLCLTWSVMRDRGWRSKQTLERARDELLEEGFLEQTRQGGRYWPSLYAITWWAIDECGGKLDVPPTHKASAKWKL
jgi:hypothetical protein